MMINKDDLKIFSKDNVGFEEKLLLLLKTHEKHRKETSVKFGGVQWSIYSLL